MPVGPSPKSSDRSTALVCAQACALLIVVGSSFSTLLLDHGNLGRLFLPAIAILASLTIVLSAMVGVLLGHVRWYVGLVVVGLLPLAFGCGVFAGDFVQFRLLLRDTYSYEMDALRLAHVLESQSPQFHAGECVTERIPAPYREVRSCYYRRTGEIYVECNRRFDGGIIYMPSGSPRREGSHRGQPLRDNWYRFRFGPRH